MTGSPRVPVSLRGGRLILATVLATVGIPPEGIALILGVDRILDMSRTAINVAGDLVACLVMDRIVDEPRSPEPGSAAPPDAAASNPEPSNTL